MAIRVSTTKETLPIYVPLLRSPEASLLHKTNLLMKLISAFLTLHQLLQTFCATHQSVLKMSILCIFISLLVHLMNLLMYL